MSATSDRGTLAITNPEMICDTLAKLVGALNESGNRYAVLETFFDAWGEEDLDDEDLEALLKFRRIWIRNPTLTKELVETIVISYSLLGAPSTDSIEVMGELLYWIAMAGYPRPE